MFIEHKSGDMYVEKHMCSTMGNGFTFSLMTLFLSAIVKTLYSFAGLPEYDTINNQRVKTWAVYGDDIIVDSSVLLGLRSILAELGFTVNVTKSYSKSLFRESCGADFYDGYPVRPVFCESLQTQADIFSLLNRLAVWGTTHSVPLPRSLSLLRRAAESGGKRIRVPNWEDVSAGIHVPVSHSLPCSQKLHGQPPLQKGSRLYECLVAQPKHRIVFKETVHKAKASSILTREIYTITYVTDVTWKTRNRFGALLHVLGGSVRDGRYGVRPLGGVPQYKTQVKIAPGWGDPSLLRGTAVTCFIGNPTQSIYRFWEEYIRRNVFSKHISDM